MLEKSKLIQEAFSWMTAHKLLATTPIMNTIYDNIKLYNPWRKSVKEVDFLLDEVNNKLLIYIEFCPPWWTLYKTLRRKAFENWVVSGLEGFIPNIKTKITFDKVSFYSIVEAIGEKE